MKILVMAMAGLAMAASAALAQTSYSETTTTVLNVTGTSVTSTIAGVSFQKEKIASTGAGDLQLVTGDPNGHVNVCLCAPLIFHCRCIPGQRCGL